MRAFRRCAQLRGEELAGDFVQLHQRRAQLGVGIVGLFSRPLLNANAHLFRNPPQRLGKRQAIHQHDELENVAAHAAAEAVEDLLDRMHRE